MRGRLAVEVKLAGEQKERKRKDPLTGRQKRNEGRMGDKRKNGNNGCRTEKEGESVRRRMELRPFLSNKSLKQRSKSESHLYYCLKYSYFSVRKHC